MVAYQVLFIMSNLTNENRSRNMSAIRSKNTKPELIVRKILYQLRYRYRLHKNSLAGKPDIYIKKNNATIFVHGCFWHQHNGCKRCFMPKTNIAYWEKKLKGNVKKFNSVKTELKRAGYKIIVIWECETKNQFELMEKLNKRLAG